MLESRQVGELIDRPASAVYDYASDPANLPRWAPGAAGAPITFVPHNEFGVLDHDITFPSGDVLRVPMRVVANGGGSEVVLTVRRMPGLTDDEFDRDCAAVEADLALLKQVLESR